MLLDVGTQRDVLRLDINNQCDIGVLYGAQDTERLDVDSTCIITFAGFRPRLPKVLDRYLSSSTSFTYTIEPAWMFL